MFRNSDRILTSHGGSLPRPANVRSHVLAKAAGQPFDANALGAELSRGISDAVRDQLAAGLDLVNDGELSKVNFKFYTQSRIGGFEMRPAAQGRRLDITARDQVAYADYFHANPVPWLKNPPATRPVCVQDLHYVGHDDLARDIANLKSAGAANGTNGLFMTALAPSSIEHWMANRHYADDQAFVQAIAEVMRIEYEAISAAGFLLQIDAPDLLDAWNCHPGMTVAQYRAHTEMRIDVLNNALRNIPRDRIRIHVCWGSYHGPHSDDIPLADMIDLIFQVKAGCYNIESSSPGHAHELAVFETVKLPPDTSLMPGVVGHFCDQLEHPRAVADRLVRFARLLGRENVQAGTDCGLGDKCGHEAISWAKFRRMAEGARIASDILWGRA